MIKEGGFYLEGQVDLWGVVDDQVWVIDYKSAKNPDAQALERARRQLEIYAYAVSLSGHDYEKIKIGVVSPLVAEFYELKKSPITSLKAAAVAAGNWTGRWGLPNQSLTAKQSPPQYTTKSPDSN